MSEGRKGLFWLMLSKVPVHQGGEDMEEKRDLHHGGQEGETEKEREREREIKCCGHSPFISSGEVFPS
jgi:hypothetical protein